jgi:hypothetical protein
MKLEHKVPSTQEIVFLNRVFFPNLKISLSILDELKKLGFGMNLQNLQIDNIVCTL